MQHSTKSMTLLGAFACASIASLAPASAGAAQAGDGAGPAAGSPSSLHPIAGLDAADGGGGATAAEPVVVTAARVGQSLDSVLPDTTVITAEQIREQQAVDLGDLLSRQVGAQIVRQGGQGSQTSLFLRGANSNQVLVLMDGMRINDPASGGPSLGGIDTASIDRIEIVRGNLSSLYGSEAIGGVVQIFTRRGDHDGASAFAEMGNGATRAVGAQASGGAGAGLRWHVDAGMREQTAISAMNPAENPGANPGLDGNHNHHGSLSLDWQQGGDSVRVFALGSRNDTSWDDNYDYSATDYTLSSVTAGRVEHSSLSTLGLSARHDTRAASLSLELGQTQEDTSNVSTLPMSPDTNTVDARSRRIALGATVHGDGLEWVSGAELLRQDGNLVDLVTDNTTYVSSYVPTDVSRHAGSAWTGATARSGDLQAQVNVRHDHYSDAGSANTGLASGGWHFAPAWMATVQWSSGFRAPTFNDLYYPNFSNPKLKPEHAQGEETALRWRQDGSSASLVLFRNHTRDLIAFRGVIPVNVASADFRGWELQGESGAGPLSWGASLTGTHSSDADTHADLLRRAHWQALAHVRIHEGAWKGGIEAGRTGARDDVDFNNYPSTPVVLAPYTLVRLTAERSFAHGVRVYARIDNALNHAYELSYGYNSLPRIAVVGVEASL